MNVAVVRHLGGEHYYVKVIEGFSQSGDGHDYGARRIQKNHTTEARVLEETRYGHGRDLNNAKLGISSRRLYRGRSRQTKDGRGSRDGAWQRRGADWTNQKQQKVRTAGVADVAISKGEKK